jgi:hypothetical protein
LEQIDELVVKLNVAHGIGGERNLAAQSRLLDNWQSMAAGRGRDGVNDLERSCLRN